jgi:hypothetical protein
MEPTNTAALESLRQATQLLVEPLKLAIAESAVETGSEPVDASDLLVGDLSMVALLLTNVDLQVSAEELALMNGLRQAVYGPGARLLQSSDYEDLCQEFLTLYPQKRLTLDSMPKSIVYLIAYDERHKTAYANQARDLFVRFAEAMLGADQNTDAMESIILLNFKDVLGVAIETD